MRRDKYPHLERFSKTIDLPTESLVKAFEIERVFHARILDEPSVERRKEMYQEVYDTVHPIYGKSATNILSGRNPKDEMVRLFRKELEGKAVLDVGCGEGYFLASVARLLEHKRLMGIDVSIPPQSKRHPEIEFISKDIIRFDVDRQFDVVFSDQVLEHIASADLPTHLKSIKRSLRSGGLLIVSLPNRVFGPSDVTRIIDSSYTNRVPAQGTHLNESTYGELIPLLRDEGFANFKTPLPLSVSRRLPWLRRFRMNPSIWVGVENRRLLLSALYCLKRRGRCIARFPITLISTAP